MCSSSIRGGVRERAVYIMRRETGPVVRKAKKKNLLLLSIDASTRPRLSLSRLFFHTAGLASLKVKKKKKKFERDKKKKTALPLSSLVPSFKRDARTQSKKKSREGEREREDADLASPSSLPRVTSPRPRAAARLLASSTIIIFIIASLRTRRKKKEKKRNQSFFSKIIINQKEKRIAVRPRALSKPRRAREREREREF